MIRKKYCSEGISEGTTEGRTTITEHISNIFKEGELEKEKVCRKIRHTTYHGAVEGKTQNQEKAEYIIKGFIMDDERLKNLGWMARKLTRERGWGKL